MVIYTPERITKALQLADFDVSAAHERMNPRPRGTRPPEMPGQPKQGAVLLIAYTKNGESYLVLTRRRDDLNAHAGQISFPGGQREPGETMQSAAFREADEEIGVSTPALEFLGELTTIYIPPTDFEVHPFVAWHRDAPIFTPQDQEVAEILEVPISHMMDPSTHHEETWDFQGYKIEVPFYLVGPHKVWGATATIMSEFLERLQTLS
jgi:8-oxo-dGTP pyrophosphatase MutT (NUDIX family)